MARRGAVGPSIPWWLWLGLIALAPLVLLNLAVAFLGGTGVGPLSPFFLESKLHALGTYVKHRPGCLVRGHPPLEPLIAAAERRHRLPRGLLEALVEVESEKRVHRISPAGAMGPGQLMPGTARLMRVADPFEPAQALDGSARYLAQQLRRFRSVPLAVAAYNAGPGSVNGRVPRNGETEHYVVKVLSAWERTRPPPPARPQRKAAAKAARARPTGAQPSKAARPLIRPAARAAPAPAATPTRRKSP